VSVATGGALIAKTFSRTKDFFDLMDERFRYRALGCGDGGFPGRARGPRLPLKEVANSTASLYSQLGNVPGLDSDCLDEHKIMRAESIDSAGSKIV
jgi:hypothetical protein